MTSWRDIRAHLEATEDPDFAAVLAELTPADRQAAGPSWFARMVAQARPRWHADGACLEHPELSWFPSKGQPTAPAKAVCSRCLVRPECLAFAIDNDERGVWGGTSEAERRVMRRDQAA